MNPTTPIVDTEIEQAELDEFIAQFYRYPGPVRAWTPADIAAMNVTMAKIEQHFAYQRFIELPPRRFTREWWRRWYRARNIEFRFKHDVRRLKRYATLVLAFAIFDAGVAAGWYLHGVHHAELQREPDLSPVVYPVDESGGEAR